MILFGSVGAGKTSSGATIARKLLERGCGGLILTAKVDEVELWKSYAKAANRSDDIVIIDDLHTNYFNIIEYESTSTPDRKAFTENIVNTLKVVIQSGEAKNSGRETEAFFENSLDLLLTQTIELIMLAYGGAVTVQKLYDVAQTIPKSTDHFRGQQGQQEKAGLGSGAFEHAYTTASNIVDKLIAEWQSKQPVERLAAMNEREFEEAACSDIPEAKIFKSIHQFFIESFIPLSSKTRAIVDMYLLSFLYRLLQEPFYSLFSKHSSNITPDDCYTKGKIIIINLAVKRYGKIGRDIQIMIKVIWQRAMERRKPEKNMRPVVLWVDEAPIFTHELDAEFQATARSAAVVTVLLAQNLNTFYANMGGKSEYKVKAFLGTIGTKLFFSNTCVETNRWASELIGHDYRTDESTTVTSSNGTSSAGVSKSLKRDALVHPEQFSRSLLTGGPRNDFKVSAYIHIQNLQFSNSYNHRKIFFTQQKQ